MSKFLRQNDIARIREGIPAGFSVEVDEPLMLKGGDIFTFRIRNGVNSVCITLETDTEQAIRARMTLYCVEEDRYEPRWTERFGILEGAVRRAVEILRIGREVPQ